MIFDFRPREDDNGDVDGEEKNSWHSSGGILPLSMSWRMEKTTALDLCLSSSFPVTMGGTNPSKIAWGFGGSRTPQAGLVFTWLEEGVMRTGSKSGRICGFLAAALNSVTACQDS